MANGMLYGIIGALSVVVVGGGLYIARQEGTFEPSDKTAAVTAPHSPAPASTSTAAQPAATPPVSSTSQAEALLAQQLVSDARQALARGDFNTANTELQQAERLAPQSAAVIAARRDFREAQQRGHESSTGIDSLVADARTAIARQDYVAASRLLDQAETIDRHGRGVEQVRAELNAAQHLPDPGRR